MSPAKGGFVSKTSKSKYRKCSRFHLSRSASLGNRLSHDDGNLVVLCLEHHDLAHTQKLLSLGLSAKELCESKKNWESGVATLDAKAVLALRKAEWARWDWINLPRVFQLATTYAVKCPNKPLVSRLRALNILDAKGLLNDSGQWRTGKTPAYWYLDFGDGMYVAAYFDIIVGQVLEKLPFIDITGYMKNKSHLRSMASPGDYVAAQTALLLQDARTFFRRKIGYYRGYAVRIEFSFDAWFCTSSSAGIDALSGRIG